MDADEVTQTAQPIQQGHGTAMVFTRLEHSIVGSLYLISAIGGAATNLLLVVALLRDGTLLRTSSSWFHIGLALANIGVVAPAPLTTLSSFSGRWLYGDRLCHAYGFEGMFVGLLAIGFVFCLCVEQYALSIRKNTRQPPSSKFYIILTIINAANALFWAAMPSMGWGRYSLDPTGTHCAIEWMNPDEGCKSYMAVICILGFAVPMAISMAILYQSFPASLTATSASSGSPRDDGFTESQLRWLSVTFLILVVVGWGPFALLIMWAIVANPFTVSMLVAASPPLACKIMTMSYPLAYNVANPKFRAGYLSMLGVSATKTSRKSE